MTKKKLLTPGGVDPESEAPLEKSADGAGKRIIRTVQIAAATDIAAVMEDRHVKEFLRRIEAGEISEYRFDLNDLDYLVGMGSQLLGPS